MMAKIKENSLLSLHLLKKENTVKDNLKIEIKVLIGPFTPLGLGLTKFFTIQHPNTDNKHWVYLQKSQLFILVSRFGFM